MTTTRCLRLAAVSAAFLVGTACVGGDGPSAGPGDPSVELVFPTQEPTGVVMEAVLEGELIRSDACLYVESIYGGRAVMPIWPHGFTYETRDGDISILDDEGHPLARVGYPLRMGGGMDGEGKDKLLRELRDDVEGCRGPYWIVGNIIEPEE